MEAIDEISKSPANTEMYIMNLFHGETGASRQRVSVAIDRNQVRTKYQTVNRIVEYHDDIDRRIIISYRKISLPVLRHSF